MELLPPVGWADVATKQDLAFLGTKIDHLEDRMDQLEERLELKFDAKFERGFRQVLVTVSSITVASFAATIATIVAVALAR